jgi:predicted  nucleic acid-binding Zn-ribbon protein
MNESAATIPEEIKRLQGRAEWWEQRAKNLEERVAELEGKKNDAEEEERERQRAIDRAVDAELRRARAAAIRAMIKLLPEAIRQAKAKPPRPALLRMILRATR